MHGDIRIDWNIKLRNRLVGRRDCDCFYCPVLAQAAFVFRSNESRFVLELN